MKRFFCIVLGTLALGNYLPAVSYGQHPLPENWQELPPEEFVSAVHLLMDTSGDPYDSTQSEAVGEHSAQLLLTTDALESEAFDVPWSLARWAGNYLSVPEKLALSTQLNALAGTQTDPTLMTYVQMRSKAALMSQTGASGAERSEFIAAWVNGNQAGFDSVPIADLAHLLGEVAYQRVKNGNVSVKWTGKIEAPQTGQYTFSVSPFNMNVEHPLYYVRKWSSVWVGGQQVVNATPEDWASEGTPVQLAAGQKTDIRVEVSYDCRGEQLFRLMAHLYWEGPGVAKSVVPTTALTPPGGQGNGLKGEYFATVDDEIISKTCEDANIDFAWIRGKRLVSGHSEALGELTERLFTLGMDPAYLAACEQREETGARHPLLYEPYLAEFLSSAQRVTFAREVLNRPALLEPVSKNKAFDFYVSYRTGSPDDALDVFGEWSRQHANHGAYFPEGFPSVLSFTHTNRARLKFAMSSCVSLEYPSHFERLETRYLVLPDGRCSLPVAYTLAYAYLLKGKMADWIGLIEGQLGTPEVAGERRVNWLLARAHAEEIRHLSQGKQPYGTDQIFAGMEWLEEASLVAESEATRRRVLKEMVVRLACVGQWEKAEALLENAEGELTSGASALALGAWRSVMVTKQELVENERKARAAAARQEYIDAMKRRQQDAADRNDTAAVARYAAIIAKAEAEQQASQEQEP